MALCIRSTLLRASPATEGSALKRRAPPTVKPILTEHAKLTRCSASADSRPAASLAFSLVLLLGGGFFVRVARVTSGASAASAACTGAEEVHKGVVGNGRQAIHPRPPAVRRCARTATLPRQHAPLLQQRQAQPAAVAARAARSSHRAAAWLALHLCSAAPPLWRRLPAKQSPRHPPCGCKRGLPKSHDAHP
jgi:hypothetical protein